MAPVTLLQSLKKLYEQWIDPETVFNSKVKSRGIEYYARLVLHYSSKDG
jgi:hypothetical protein